MFAISVINILFFPCPEWEYIFRAKDWFNPIRYDYPWKSRADVYKRQVQNVLCVLSVINGVICNVWNSEPMPSLSMYCWTIRANRWISRMLITKIFLSISNSCRPDWRIIRKRNNDFSDNHHSDNQGYSVNVPLSKKSREKLCFTWAFLLIFSFNSPSLLSFL